MEMKRLPSPEHIDSAATLVISPHPISAVRDRKIAKMPVFGGQNMAVLLRRAGFSPSNDDFVASLNGEIVPRQDWAHTRVESGDILTLRAAVHQGGDGDSDPLRVVLTIAVLTVAPQVGAWGGILTSGSIAPVVGQALFSIGGMLLINQLLPYEPPAPDKQPSPTYSLAGSQNRSRLFEPLPLVLGVHRIFPDHGAKPYTEFVGNDQYLYQIFNFGLSDISISNVQIGDTDINTYADVTQEVSDNTGVLTLFPANVDTLAGGPLTGTALDTFVTKTSSVGTTELGIELQGICYFQGKKGIEPLRLTLDIEYRAVGSSTWLAFTGSNPVYIEHGSRETLRWGIQKTVPVGQYEVRVKLRGPNAEVVRQRDISDPDVDNEPIWEKYYVPTAITDPPGPNAYVSLNWHQLKSFQADNADYTGQTRMALKIRASGQLNGSVQALNAIASAQVPVWNGTAWGTQVSSNPAWQFLWLARGKTLNGQRIFGANLPDSRIDIEEIKAWGAWCDAKNLQCNLIFDRQGQSVDEQLRIVARCGRAAPTWAKGVLGIVYDEGGRPVTGVYGMSNIVRNSFNISYLTGQLADEIVVNWINPALGYKPDTVRAVVPGIVNPVNPVTLTIQGITNENQAGREANLFAAEQQERRRQITWETDIEGMTQNRGDVVVLSHDLTQWGYSGRLVSGTTTQLVLDREVPFTSGQQHYIGVRYPDGSYNIYDVDFQTGPSSVITLSTPLPSAPDDDTSNPVRDYLWFFEPEATPGKKVKITDIKPLSEHRLRITATDETDNYYLAENNSYTYITPNTFGVETPTIADLAVSDTLTVVGSGFGTRITATWNVTGQYGGALIRAGAVGEPLTDRGRTFDTRFEFDWPVAEGDIVVEVQVFNQQAQIGVNGSASLTHAIEGKNAPPSDVAGLTALQNGASVVIKWNANPDVDHAGTEIRYGARGLSNWADATPLTEVTKGTNITTAALPPGDLTLYAKHRDTSGFESKNAASVDLVVVNEYNIIVQQQQAPAWPGILTNFVKHWTGILFPESTSTIDALGWRVFDEFAPDPQPVCEYEAPEIDIDFDDDVRVWAGIDSYLGPGITTGIADPELQIDYRLEAGSYDGFESWGVGDVRLRYCKQKLVLDTTKGVAAVSGFNPTVDLLEHTISADNIAVAAGGATLSFATPFHLPPRVAVSFVGSTAKIAVPNNVTTAGFDVNVFDTSGTNTGTDAGESVRYDATGV